MGWLDIPSHEVVSGNLVSTAQRAISHVLKGRRVSESSEGEEEYEVGVTSYVMLFTVCI